MKRRLTARLALVLALAGTAPTIGAATASAAFEGANGKIAFESSVAGNFDIWVMDANGTGRVNVSKDTAADRDPAWSPYGAKIAFSRASEGHMNVWVMNADGSGQVNLTPGANDGEGNTGIEPTWSADGTRIAYADSADIWVMNANGTNKARLTDTPADTESSPAWSPDGSRIAFRRGHDIYVMNASGGAATPLTSTTRGEARPEWSPDGTRIAYDRDADVWVMNADGSGQTALTGGLHGEGGTEPGWSPDGTQIAFSSNAYGAPNGHDIFVMNADGTGVSRRNTPVPAGDLDPNWQRVATPNLYVAGNGVLTFRADAARANAMTVESSGGTYTVTDTAGSLDTGAGCTPVSATQATCTGAITSISANLGTLNDSITVDAATRTTLRGGTGNDSLTGGPAADVLEGGNGADSLTGRAGTDTATYAGRPVAVVVDLDGVADDGGTLDVSGGVRDNVRADVENVTGGSLGDTLTGSSRANVLEGGNGADIFNGLGGVDTVTYGSRWGGVVVDVDGVADDGNPADGPAALRDDVRTDVENVTGGYGADTLTGSPAANALRGTLGNDTIFARDGVRDVVDGGVGSDSAQVDGGLDAVTAIETFIP